MAETVEVTVMYRGHQRKGRLLKRGRVNAQVQFETGSGKTKTGYFRIVHTLPTENGTALVPVPAKKAAPLLQKAEGLAVKTMRRAAYDPGSVRERRQSLLDEAATALEQVRQCPSCRALRRTAQELANQAERLLIAAVDEAEEMPKRRTRVVYQPEEE